MQRINTVIITGGGGHLGRHVARWWARPGISLVLIDRDAERLEQCRPELVALGAEIFPVVADIALPDAIDAAAAALPEGLWSSPAALVVTHGIAGKGAGAQAARLGDLDRGLWQEILDVNLTSAVFAIQSFLPYLKQAGGRIVLVSSTAGVSASPTAALSYSVAKAGIAALPRLLAPELARSGVLINAVAPGKFSNPGWPDDPQMVKRYEQGVPLGRLASAEEIAALIGFLSSAANTYLTGQTIIQDGGRLSALLTVD